MSIPRLPSSSRLGRATQRLHLLREVGNRPSQRTKTVKKAEEIGPREGSREDGEAKEMGSCLLTPPPPNAGRPA